MKLLDHFQPVYRLKELFRQGWIGIVPGSEIESVADHSYAITMLAMILVPIENELRIINKSPLKLLNKLMILENCLIHDLPESKYLDMDKSFSKLLSAEKLANFKHELDYNSKNSIQSDLDNLVENVFNLKDNNLLNNFSSTYNQEESEESSFVKVLDILELHLQTLNYLKSGFIKKENAEPFITSTLNNLKSFEQKFEIVTFILDKLYLDR